MTIDQTQKPANRIVVGVDGSVPSEHALRWAQFMAHASGSYVEAVAAWEPFASYGWLAAGWEIVPNGWDPALDAEKYLTSTVDRVFAESRPAGLQLSVRQGNAAKVLLEAAKGAQMLIVGNRGHGGFTDLLLGSVSAACTHHATCPVLVVHGDTPAPGFL
ncbi:MAG: universal stress protein UspA [Pseudonocardiales bacterium]|nr:universal stress protein UspA [Pseudonocardiales bacterium]